MCCQEARPAELHLGTLLIRAAVCTHIISAQMEVLHFAIENGQTHPTSHVQIQRRQCCVSVLVAGSPRGVMQTSSGMKKAHLPNYNGDETAHLHTPYHSRRLRRPCF